jgi:glycerophosphoryl diester phosphodiesterase
VTAWHLAAGGPPLVLGHRGASARAVENTMTAFAAAMADGADGVELDVRLAADGTLVVFHDDDLVRLAGRTERVDRLSGAQIAAVRLQGGERIPTLREVLAGLPGALVNVEIKAISARVALPTARAVVAEIERAGASERIVVSSFDPTAVAAIRLLMPRVRTGLLFHKGQSGFFREAHLASLLRPYAVHPDRYLVDNDHMVRWRKAGYAIHAWTVDEPDEIARLVRFGVDALITNDPAATRRCLPS